MADLFKELADKIKGRDLRLIFPEGDDTRIQQAAGKLVAENLLQPILIGSERKIKDTAAALNLDTSSWEIIDPEKVSKDQKDELAQKLVERRKGKTDLPTAIERLKDPNYLATMLVYLRQADAMVSGAAHPTADTVRPALQIIKTDQESRRISGSFIMQKGEKRFVFADCAINIDPDAESLAEIAVQSIKTAKKFGIKPKTAFLSFSTKGSAKHDLVDKVVQAAAIAKKKLPEEAENIDGELQFDAAFVPEVASSKAPGSNVAGQANVFIFPSLEAGNIGYKIAQLMGGFQAIGPILQGLAAPVSDLSRGADSDDVYKVAILTAAQAL